MVIGKWESGWVAAKEIGGAKEKRADVADKKRCKSVKSRL